MSGPIKSGGPGGIGNNLPTVNEKTPSIIELDAAAFGADINIPGFKGTKGSKAPKESGANAGAGSPGPGMPPPPSSPGSPQGTQSFVSAMNYFASLGGGDGAASVFACMMQMQKMLNKEARAERKAEIADAKNLNKMKDAKIDMQITKIGEMKVEARERFDHAMDAAAWEMGLGIASGCAAALSVCGSFGGELSSISASFKGVMTVLGTIGKIADAGTKLVQAGATMHIAQNKNFADLQKANGLKSDETEKLINLQEKSINKKTEEAAESKATSDEARDRRKAGLDNLQKIIDIIHQLPSVQG